MNQAKEFTTVSMPQGNGNTPQAGDPNNPNQPQAGDPSNPTTPAPNTPQAGGNDAPQAPATLEEALALLQTLQDDVTDSRKQAARYRTQLRELQKASQTAQGNQQAQTPPAATNAPAQPDPLAQAKAAYDQQLATMKAQLTQSQLATVASQLGVVDPALVAQLAAQSDDLDIDGAGMPSNAQQVIKAILRARPYLAKAAATSPANADRASGAQAAGTFKESQLADVDFYNKNRAAILQAMREGKIILGE